MPDPGQTVLEVRNLKTVFQTRGGEVHAVNDVSFELRPGELLGVVGESGSGKSVTMMSLLKLLPIPPAEIRSGTVKFDGKDLLRVDADTLRAVRGGKIGFVFQDPMTSLNPVFTVGMQLMERCAITWELVETSAAADAAWAIAWNSSRHSRRGRRRLGLPRISLSGGCASGVIVAIASGLSIQRMLIADEPTTSVCDVTDSGAVSSNLMTELQERTGLWR